MSAALQVACLVVALPFALLGLAKARATDTMRARAAHLGYSPGAYRVIGALELAAVAGLLSARWFPLLALAALSGLALLLLGAVVAHLRNGDGVRGVAPAVVLLVVVCGVGTGVVS